jgi:hypothetical protein
MLGFTYTAFLAVPESPLLPHPPKTNIPQAIKINKTELKIFVVFLFLRDDKLVLRFMWTAS